MEFRILGALEVLDEGRQLPIRGARQRGLLALLLLQPNRAIPTSRLIDELWDDDPPAEARKGIQVQVSQLRKTLGSDRVEARGNGYALRAERNEIDAARFEDAVNAAQRADPRTASAQLSEALALWRGRPLEDVSEVRALQPEISRLEELRLVALERRLDADLELGRHSQVVPELDRLVMEIRSGSGSDAS